MECVSAINILELSGTDYLRVYRLSADALPFKIRSGKTDI